MTSWLTRLGEVLAIGPAPRAQVRQSCDRLCSAINRRWPQAALELKVSKGYDRIVGQLLRYVKWVRQNLAEPGQRVRGIIVCRTLSEDLRLACASIKDSRAARVPAVGDVDEVPALELPA